MLGIKLGIRDKLIGIFILIKVVPLVILAWFAWNQISKFSATVQMHVDAMATQSRGVIESVSGLASKNSIRALDERSREAIERLTTDTAQSVANFLYDRDRDIESAARLQPSRDQYATFLSTRRRAVIEHQPWEMDAQGVSWIPSQSVSVAAPEIHATNEDNSRDFHYRPPERTGQSAMRPLFLEMSFIDKSGQEIVKVTTSDIMPGDLRDVSIKENTYCKAETYFEKLSSLRPGEIYVSDVIGAYQKAHFVGMYNKSRAAELGIEFAPESSGYAGKENPVGKRFQALVRWAAPVVDQNEIVGYVTLALDHTHLMEFTDHVIPTEERYRDISDAGTGNYAFMWDYKDRCISHARDYFIVGYDPETGDPAPPWLDQELYDQWVQSGDSLADFLRDTPSFIAPSLKKKPSKELIQKGYFGLDCRYLNFAPQCAGWNNITSTGGSGSFLIFWSGIWKLTTAASIPYYTGQYAEHARGFGYVTIGANVHEFHKPAMETAEDISSIEKKYTQDLEQQNRKNRSLTLAALTRTARDLSWYTMAMIVIVIIVAIWMASTLTGRITNMILGIRRFQNGEMDFRLAEKSKDEMGRLTRTFNEMADTVAHSIADIQTARDAAEEANLRLTREVTVREETEKELAAHRDNLEDLVADRTTELQREIAERTRVEQYLRQGEARLSIQNKTLLQLTERKTWHHGDLERSLEAIVQASAHTLDTNRAGVWMLSDDGLIIRCVAMFDIGKGRANVSLEEGVVLSASDYPLYFQALAQEGIIAVHDVEADLRTKELLSSYYAPAGIVATLSAVVRVDGQMVGLVSHEHLSKPRKWKIDEQNFAGSVADIVSLAIESSKRRQAQQSKRNLEARLHRAEKMEAIGTLAGGVAHDLNNILSGIVSYPDLLLLRLPSDSSMRKPIETIRESGKKAAAIVQDLLTLARRGVPVTEVMNLNEIVTHYLKSPEHQKVVSYHPDVRIDLELEPNLLPIIGSSVHLSKTLMNLVTNAMEAMPDGGQLRLKTENRYVDRPIGDYDAVEEGDYATLSVSDTGVGIAMPDRERIFEPFYTKKKMGRSGTGLGMAVVWGTVKDHRGYIDFASGEGEGTTFKLYFPVTRQEMKTSLFDGNMPDIRGNGEKVLVIDDVKEQREIASMMLTELGYEAVSAASGEEAIAYLTDQQVDIVILDMIMDAGLDGLDTYRKILEIHPAQKAIIASGYSETHRIREAQRLGAGQYLKKPYSLEKLGVYINKELSS